MTTKAPLATDDQSPLKAAIQAVMKHMDEYEEGYEFRGEDTSGRDACYTPNEQEELLIHDAITGLVDEDFVTLVGNWYIERQKARAAQGHCLTCGAPKGQHWGNRCG